ncbi:hypothetical protein NEIG_01693 [Nematocida sp. ERTm5]|nr:hypothetical protein NEIG_01693 [Nematocida sp. ERTm5]
MKRIASCIVIVSICVLCTQTNIVQESAITQNAHTENNLSSGGSLFEISANPVLATNIQIDNQREHLEKIECMLASAVDKYKNNTEEALSEEQVRKKRDLGSWSTLKMYTKQIYLDKVELYEWNSTTWGFSNEYKKKTGTDLESDINHWKRDSDNIYRSFYELINSGLFTNYFLNDPTISYYKILDFPILTSDITKYYNLIIDNLNSIIKLANIKEDGRSPDLDAKKSAEYFLSLTFPSYVFKEFDFNNITQYQSAEEYIEKKNS